jgi:DNA-binding CsgD family transcriptional regulator
MATTAAIGTRVTSPALVGRSWELSRLVSAVQAAPAVVVVEGEAGIGKTRLVSELRDRLGSDRRFAAGWCRWIREPFPLGPVIEAIRGLGAQLARTSLSPVAGALRPLLPELSAVLPPPPPPLDDRAAERHRVFRALVEVLTAVGPGVLVLEDAHWADEQTVDFVTYLLGDPPPELSVVITIRGEDVDPAVRALAAKLPRSVSRTELALRPLDRNETGELAAAILGTGHVSRDFASYLREWTSGLPFAIEEVLAVLQGRAPSGRGDTYSRRALERLDVPSGIRDPVMMRVSQLSADARTVVEAAAVLQSTLPAPVLTATCRVPTGRALRATEEVLASGLLVEDGDRIGFRHLLAAQAVYEALPGPRRRQLHARAATALTVINPPPLGQLAHHLRHAGQLGAWVTAAERAADQAAGLGHDDEVVRLLEQVLRHAPLDHEQRGRIALKLARAAVETLHAQDVLQLLLEVPTEQLPAQTRSELRWWLSLLLNQTGDDPTLQRRLTEEAIAELDGRPDLKAWAMVGLGIPIGAPDVPLAEHLQWLRRSLDLLGQFADPALEVLVLGKVAMVLTSVGDRSWRQLTDRMLAQTGGVPGQRREVSAYESVGTDACYAGHHEIAHQLLTAALTGAEACQSRRLELRARARLALLDYCRGSWDGLRQRAEHLVEDLAHYAEARVDAEVVAGCLALAEGDLDEAEQRLTSVVRCIESADGLDLVQLPAAALVRLALARGDVDLALSTAQRAMAGAESKGVLPPAARVLPPLAQAMVEGGPPADAAAMVDRIACRLRGLDAPLGTAAVRHAQGFVAAGQRRWRAAAGHFLAAADHYQPLACRYEAEQAREQAARCLFVLGDTRGETVICEALAAYQQVGATWDADRVSSIARQHNVPLPASYRGGRRGYGDQLSPRERQVAKLAADGLTNEQIAHHLYLSPKTVDKHICAALRKLKLHSRRSLSHHFAIGGGKDGVRTP